MIDYSYIKLLYINYDKKLCIFIYRPDHPSHSFLADFYTHLGYIECISKENCNVHCCKDISRIWNVVFFEVKLLGSHTVVFGNGLQNYDFLLRHHSYLFYPFLTLSADLSTASQSKLMTEAIVKERNLAARQFISLMTQLAKRNLKGLTSRRAMYKKGDVKCVPYISKYTYFSIIAFFLSNRDALFNKKALQNAIRQLNCRLQIICELRELHKKSQKHYAFTQIT